MTNDEILSKAIEKATKNGWKLPFSDVALHIDIRKYGSEPIVHSILLSHDFAKALWGEDEVRSYFCWGCNTGEVRRHHEACQCQYKVAWKHHLQQMVLEPNPIKYLEKFI